MRFTFLEVNLVYAWHHQIVVGTVSTKAQKSQMVLLRLRDLCVYIVSNHLYLYIAVLTIKCSIVKHLDTWNSTIHLGELFCTCLLSFSIDTAVNKSNASPFSPPHSWAFESVGIWTRRIFDAAPALHIKVFIAEFIPIEYAYKDFSALYIFTVV